MGRVDVDTMLASMSSSLFSEWIAFSNLEPFGYSAENWRAGLVASTIANCNRKKGAPPFTPKDFMPKEQRAQSWQQQMAILKQLPTSRKGDNHGHSR